tara:strand:+ start:578 stop:985 length:408 start_codon:yes stop_codon:yes gene_type:complete
MAKITISRLFEVSAYLTTEAGKELKEALVYLSEFVEVTIRSLRNGLTFVDNFDVTAKSVQVRSGAETVILTDEKKRVKEVVCRRVSHDKYYLVNSFGWRYNAKGEVVITLTLLDASGSAIATTTDVNIDLLVHFG